MPSNPIVPTGYYYTPALRSMGAQGFFEGALGGLDRAQAQDLARERLRNLREERQWRTAGRAAGLQEELVGDALGDLLAGGARPAAGPGGGRRVGRYSTARERAPISQIDAERAAAAQHQQAELDRTLLDYQLLKAQAGAAPAQSPLQGTVKAGEAAIEPGALHLSEAERYLQEYSGGGQRLRDLEEDVLITPAASEYREALSRARRESPDTWRTMVDTPKWSEGGPSRAPEVEAELALQFPEAIRRQKELREQRATTPEGWTWAGDPAAVEGDPFAKSARSLGDESVDPRDAPPSLRSIAEALASKPAGMERDNLKKAYNQLLMGKAAEKRAWESGDPEAQMAADSQIQEAMALLDPGLLAAMENISPQMPGAQWEGQSEADKARVRRMRGVAPAYEPWANYAFDKYDKELGIWNPAVDIGLAPSTVLNPSTLAKIGSLADSGNPMAARVLGRMGSEPVSAQEAIKKGLVGDVSEYRSKLADHLEEEQQLLKDAGISDDERAKAFIHMQNRIYGEGTFSVDNPDDMAMAKYAVTLHPRNLEGFMEQLHSKTSHGRKMELEDAATARKRVPSKVINIRAGGGRNEDIKLLGIEVDSLEKLRGLRSRKLFQRSDAAYTEEKFPDLDREIATLKQEVIDTEDRIKAIKKRLYPGESGGGVVPGDTSKDDKPTEAELDARKASPAGQRVKQQLLDPKLRTWLDSHGISQAQLMAAMADRIDSSEGGGGVVPGDTPKEGVDEAPPPAPAPPQRKAKPPTSESLRRAFEKRLRGANAKSRDDVAEVLAEAVAGVESAGDDAALALAREVQESMLAEIADSTDKWYTLPWLR